MINTWNFKKCLTLLEKNLCKICYKHSFLKKEKKKKKTDFTKQNVFLLNEGHYYKHQLWYWTVKQ